jgi:hypothetical protein
MQAWGAPGDVSTVRRRGPQEAQQLAEETRMVVRATSDGGLEVLSPFHWWCRSCGRWEACDDADLCSDCAWMRAEDPAPAPRRRGGPATGGASRGSDAA